MGNPVIDFPWDKVNIPGVDTLVRTGPCVLHQINFNGMTAVGDVALYDGIDNTGTLIATFYFRTAVHVSCQPISFNFDCEMSVGIYLDYDATCTADLTVMFK